MLPSNQEKALLVKAENNRASHYILRSYLFPLFICRLFPQQHCPLDNTTWPLQRKGMKCDFVMLEKKKLFSKHQANTRLVIGTHEFLENDCVQFHAISHCRCSLGNPVEIGELQIIIRCEK
jgi:hypothetical protein